MCDSIVYGKMPGKGRRVWQASQFRFRVVYSIPQIRLHHIVWRYRLLVISNEYGSRPNRLPEPGEQEAEEDDELVIVKLWHNPTVLVRWGWLTMKHHLSKIGWWEDPLKRFEKEGGRADDPERSNLDAAAGLERAKGGVQEVGPRRRKPSHSADVDKVDAGPFHEPGFGDIVDLEGDILREPRVAGLETRCDRS
jgi:hypothetical protein